MYFMDKSDDTQPRKLFCFDGSSFNLVCKDLCMMVDPGKDLGIIVYKFMAEGECV